MKQTEDRTVCAPFERALKDIVFASTAGITVPRRPPKAHEGPRERLMGPNHPGTRAPTGQSPLAAVRVTDFASTKFCNIWFVFDKVINVKLHVKS